MSTCYYAVLVGRRPGVYTVYNDFIYQVEDYYGACSKKCKSEAEAFDFVQQVGIHCYRTDLLLQKISLSFGYPCDLHGVLRQMVEVKVWIHGSCLKNGQDDAQAGMAVFWGPESEWQSWNMCERVTNPNSQTNNAAVLIAAKRAIEIALNNRIRYLRICTNSSYVIKCFKMWAHSWSRNNWYTLRGQPVKNLQLIKKIYDLLQQAAVDRRMQCYWMYIPLRYSDVAMQNAAYMARYAAANNS